MSTSPGRAAFARPLEISGGGPGSAWGYDDVFECYWAEVPQRPLRIGPERLLVTLTGLARVLGAALDLSDDEAYLALTA